MNATEIVLPGTVEPEGLQITSRELPDPRPDQAVVRVEATGVSFAEQQMRRGKYYDQPPFPFVPGYDLVGTIERLGDGGRDLTVGRRVAALTKTGAWADRVVLHTAELTPVPDGVDAAAAENVVVNGVPRCACSAPRACGPARRSSFSARLAASARPWSRSPATGASA